MAFQIWYPWQYRIQSQVAQSKHFYFGLLSAFLKGRDIESVMQALIKPCNQPLTRTEQNRIKIKKVTEW